MGERQHSSHCPQLSSHAHYPVGSAQYVRPNWVAGVGGGTSTPPRLDAGLAKPVAIYGGPKGLQRRPCTMLQRTLFHFLLEYQAGKEKRTAKYSLSRFRPSVMGGGMTMACGPRSAGVATLGKKNSSTDSPTSQRPFMLIAALARP